MTTGCSEDDIIDCIDFDGPEFNPTELSSAELYQPYLQRIDVAIANEPYDNLFNYSLKFSGELPAGITLKWGDNQQSVTLEGIPTRTGLFEFELAVKVSDPSYDNGIVYQQTEGEVQDNLCYDSEKINYQFQVI
ncbi:hypothetical protein D5085_01500 [Ectothiorhodospiraceae bacterium BW-2]|nr:hypothetical protein D5085_01500 [Ectothiorhodospiraceae bacterium BW-2]